jgi:hypothetical protein
VASALAALIGPHLAYRILLLQASRQPSTTCWRVLSLQVRSCGWSSQCAPVGPSSARSDVNRNDRRRPCGTPPCRGVVHLAAPGSAPGHPRLGPVPPAALSGHPALAQLAPAPARNRQATCRGRPSMPSRPSTLSADVSSGMDRACDEPILRSKLWRSHAVTGGRVSRLCVGTSALAIMSRSCMSAVTVILSYMSGRETSRFRKVAFSS